jgi:hypothetical protein
VLGADAEDALLEEGPTLTEWLALAPEEAAKLFVRRPDVYEALVLRCPKCNSRGPAKVCTKCGVSRRNVVEPRPWTAAAKPCEAWLAGQEGKGLRVIPPAESDRAAMGAKQLVTDSAVVAVSQEALCLPRVEGEWVDEASGVEFPVWAAIYALPREGSAWDDSVVLYSEPRNADPKMWETAVGSGGWPLAASLALQLVNKATDGARRNVLWGLCERDEPRVLGRRRAAAETLTKGAEMLNGVTAAYAACLAANHWPSFEPAGEQAMSAWTEVSVEPWMTASSASDGGFFAPGAVRRMQSGATPDGAA